MSTINSIRSHVAGESLELPFEISGMDETVSITAEEIDWRLVPSKRHDDTEALVTLDDPGVSIEVTSVDTFTVTIEEGVTDGLGEQDLHERVEVDPDNGSLRKWGAPFIVRRH